MKHKRPIEKVDKNDHLSPMQRSVVKDVCVENLLKDVLTDQSDERTLYIAGIGVSYYEEGYSEFTTEVR